MDDTAVSAVVGLVGALIGASAAIGGQALNNRHQERAERRRELRDLIARFWSAADQTWRASEGLEVAVFSLGNAQQSKQPSSVIDHYDQRRIESMRVQHEGEVEGRRVLAQLRILYPSLAQQATEVLNRSMHYDMDRRKEQRLNRAKAVTAFELSSRDLAADRPPRWQWIARRRFDAEGIGAGT